MKNLFLTTLALIVFSSHVWATPIRLDTSVSQPANAGDGTIKTWLIGAINNYNVINGTSLSVSGVGAHPDIKINSSDPVQGIYPLFGNNTLSITLPADLNYYVVLHWGGNGGGIFEAYDLTTLPEVSDIFSSPGRNGLSSYAFYGISAPVPEPGTMALLGVGFFGLAVYGKRRANNNRG